MVFGVFGFNFILIRDRFTRMKIVRTMKLVDFAKVSKSREVTAMIIAMVTMVVA